MNPAAWRPDDDDLAALETEHRARVAALDPLVAVPALGATTDDERLLAVRLPDGSRAAGLLGVGTSGRTPWRRGSARCASTGCGRAQRTGRGWRGPRARGGLDGARGARPR